MWARSNGQGEGPLREGAQQRCGPGRTQRDSGYAGRIWPLPAPPLPAPVVELARAHATPMHAAFVDFSKAFDSVNHEALWEVLEARGIHPKLISLIKDLYEGKAEVCL